MQVWCCPVHVHGPFWCRLPSSLCTCRLCAGCFQQPSHATVRAKLSCDPSISIPCMCVWESGGGQTGSASKCAAHADAILCCGTCSPTSVSGPGSYLLVAMACSQLRRCLRASITCSVCLTAIQSFPSHRHSSQLAMGGHTHDITTSHEHSAGWLDFAWQLESKVHGACFSLKFRVTHAV
jgi:hypothetical protein